VEQIKSQMDNLAELGDDQVVELQQAIISEFEAFESQELSPETVDAMTALADMLDNVRNEIQRREAEAEELATRAAEAAQRVMGEGEETEGEEAPMDEMVPAEEMPEEAPAEEIETEEALPMVEDEEEDDAKKMESYSSDEDEASVESTEDPVEASAVNEEVTEFSTADEPEAETQEFSSEEESVEVAEEVSELSTTEVADVATEEPIEALAASAEEGEKSAPEETDETPIALEEQEEQAPVTAAAEGAFEAPATHQPVLQVTETAEVAITAGADIPGYTAGSTIKDISEVASAMEKRIHALRRVNGGDGEQHIVASFTTQYPEHRTLSTDAESNAKKIDAVVGQEALVASGGHSTPFEVRYDIFGVGTTERPVRDALPKFQADRGGIRYIVPPSLITGTTVNYDTAVGVWTAANDAAETPSPATKGSLTVAAATETTVATDAVTLQLQFGNLMTRAYPELISRHNELALIQHAREAEDYLISKIGTASTAVNAHVATSEAASLIGVARDFLVQVRKAAIAYRSRHRLDRDIRLKAIVPMWIYDAMASDLALNMPGDDNLAVGINEINGYVGMSGVDLVPSLDLAKFGGQAGSAAKLLEFPDSFTWYLFAEGTFLFLDGGVLDLGIIRDSTLVGTNDYKMFIETFEAVAMVGVESLAITTAISVNGVAAALRDTTGGATAAAIEE
jgi:chemotaxis protein histidine kinase CheA